MNTLIHMHVVHDSIVCVQMNLKYIYIYTVIFLSTCYWLHVKCSVPVGLFALA